MVVSSMVRPSQLTTSHPRVSILISAAHGSHSLYSSIRSGLGEMCLTHPAHHLDIVTSSSTGMHTTVSRTTSSRVRCRLGRARHTVRTSADLQQKREEWTGSREAPFSFLLHYCFASSLLLLDVVSTIWANTASPSFRKQVGAYVLVASGRSGKQCRTMTTVVSDQISFAIARERTDSNSIILLHFTSSTTCCH